MKLNSDRVRDLVLHVWQSIGRGVSARISGTIDSRETVKAAEDQTIYELSDYQVTADEFTEEQ